MRRTTAAAAAVVASGVATPAHAAARPAAAGAAQSQPNFLFLLIDDLGWADISFEGLPEDRDAGGHAEYKTPHIDALAREAVTLNDYYVNKFCSPTRSSLLSGRWAYNLGLSTFIVANGHPTGLPLSEVTVADALEALGYTNYAIGKWDVGMTTANMTPVGRGFHNFLGYYNSAETYFTHVTGPYCGRDAHGAVLPCPKCGGIDFHNDTRDAEGRPLLRPLLDRSTYSTELYTAEAVRIIERHAAGAVQTPFFIYAAYQATHAPLEAPRRFLDDAGCAGVGEVNRHIFCAMARALDEGVGNITTALAAGGLADDTVIVWSTDNGGQNGLGGNNWPLRGNKGGCFEGGVRGSGFVWGKRVTGGGGGRLWRGLSHVADWLATLVDAAGGEVPPGKDSVSLWGALRSGGASPRAEALLQLAGPADWEGKPWADGYVEPDAAIRVGKWKLVVHQGESPCPNSPNVSGTASTTAGCTGCLCGATGWVAVVGDHRNYSKPAPEQACYAHPCLFDLEADPTERRDLSGENPAQVKALLARLAYYNRTHQPDISDPTFDNASCPQPPDYVWMPWR